MPGLARYSRPFITPSYGYYNCDCEPVNGYDTGNAYDSVTYANAISGSGCLAKLGAGMLTLAGSNTYTGATTVYAGTLVLGSPSAVQNSTLTLPYGSTGTVVVGAAGGLAPKVAVTDLSAGAGTVNATNPLAIASTLILPGGVVTATLNGGSFFTATGTNLANKSFPSTMALSGGTLSLRASVLGTVYAENFNNGNGGYVNSWLSGDPNNYQSWSYDAIGGQTGGGWVVSGYHGGNGNPAESALTSPTVTFAGGGPASLQFSNNYNASADPQWDGDFLQINMNGSGWTNVTTTAFTQGGYNSTGANYNGLPWSNQPIWTGSSGGWITTAVTRLPLALRAL